MLSADPTETNIVRPHPARTPAFAASSWLADRQMPGGHTTCGLAASLRIASSREIRGTAATRFRPRDIDKSRIRVPVGQKGDARTE